jgi:hypothetical protein
MMREKLVRARLGTSGRGHGRGGTEAGGVGGGSAAGVRMGELGRRIGPCDTGRPLAGAGAAERAGDHERAELAASGASAARVAVGGAGGGAAARAERIEGREVMSEIADGIRSPPVQRGEPPGHLPEAGGAPGGGGTRFAVWAPSADEVSVVGEFNGWDRGANPLEPQGGSGIWAGTVAGAARGSCTSTSSGTTGTATGWRRRTRWGSCRRHRPGPGR